MAKHKTANDANKGTKQPMVAQDRLKLISAAQLLNLEPLPSTKYWGHRIASGELGTICGEHGSWVAMAVAVAISTGTKFLGRPCKSPRKVVYLDGVMDYRTVRRRFRGIASGLGAELTDSLQIFTPDTFTGVLPALNVKDEHVAVDEMIGTDWDVMIIDNYSAWSDGRETAEAWAPMMKWMRDYKRAQKTIVVVHWNGKRGPQRGHNRNEKGLDFSIQVKDQKTKGNALNFDLVWKKARQRTARQSRPISVTMRFAKKGKVLWSHAETEKEIQLAEMKRLRGKGFVLQKIAKKFDVNRSTVSRSLRNSR